MHRFLRNKTSAVGALALGGLLGGLWAVRCPVPTASAYTNRKAEGAELFATRGCAHCHGDSGEGTDSGPSLRDVRSRLSAKEIQAQIVGGGKGMPAFGSSLGPEQVKSLIAFLRAKDWTAPPKPPAP